MKKSQNSRWTGGMHKAKPYQDELSAAVEISHTWRELETQVVIEIENIPGWLTPLWSIDAGWLYIRRPEGVWKTRLPAFRKKVPIIFTQRFPDGSFRGSEYIGNSLASTLSWMRGPDDPTSPSDLDDDLCAAGYGIDADEVGDPLTAVFEDSPQRYIVDAGELFNRQPKVKFDGNWVVCRDALSGRTVAYGVDSQPHIRRAIGEGRLWLRFSGPYMDPFVIHVACQKSA